MLLAAALAVPLAFSRAAAARGDALWLHLSPPGKFLAVQVLRARGLTPRDALPDPDTAGGNASTDASSLLLLRHAYAFVRTRPLSASGEQYRTATAAASRAPEWPAEDVTFDTGGAMSHVHSVEVQLWDLVTPTAGQWLGSARAALPPPGAPVTPYAVRASLAPAPGIAEGWYGVSMRDTDDAAADAGVDSRGDDAAGAGAEVYVRVSYAARHARSGYCEVPRLEASVAQPSNSWSNAPFIASGAHMLAVALQDARSGGDAAARGGMARFPLVSAVNGCAQCFAGASSFLFHASMAASTQRLDVTGVYCVVAVPTIYLLLRLGALGPPRGARARVVFLASAAGAAAVLQLHAWRLERPARGCTPIVLAGLAAMAALLALWLWVLGSPLAEDEEAAPAEANDGDAAELQQPACKTDACPRAQWRRRRALPRGMAYGLCAAAAACILAAYGACASVR
jgi:hypothetical protein